MQASCTRQDAHLLSLAVAPQVLCDVVYETRQLLVVFKAISSRTRQPDNLRLPRARVYWFLHVARPV